MKQSGTIFKYTVYRLPLILNRDIAPQGICVFPVDGGTCSSHKSASYLAVELPVIQGSVGVRTNKELIQ